MARDVVEHFPTVCEGLGSISHYCKTKTALNIIFYYSFALNYFLWVKIPEVELFVLILMAYREESFLILWLPNMKLNQLACLRCCDGVRRQDTLLLSLVVSFCLDPIPLTFFSY